MGSRVRGSARAWGISGVVLFTSLWQDVREAFQMNKGYCRSLDNCKGYSGPTLVSYISMVQCTSNRPQNNAGNYLGLYSIWT